MVLLDLSRRDLDSAATAQALRELRTDTSVTKLDLSGNSAIFAAGVAAPGPPGGAQPPVAAIDELCAVLAENTTLTSLDISDTDLGPAEASALALALRGNRTINSLGLKNCRSAAPVLQALLMR